MPYQVRANLFGSTSPGYGQSIGFLERANVL